MEKINNLINNIISGKLSVYNLTAVDEQRVILAGGYPHARSMQAKVIEIISKKYASLGVRRIKYQSPDESIVPSVFSVDTNGVKIFPSVLNRLMLPVVVIPMGEEYFVEKREIREKRDEIRENNITKFKEIAGRDVPPTYENLRIFLYALQQDEVKHSDLPNFGTDYSYNRHNCDGVIAAAIKFDKPVGEDAHDMYVLGAPHGYLMKYTRI